MQAPWRRLVSTRIITPQCPLLVGTICGLCLLNGVWAFISAWGVSPPVLAGLFTAGLAALWLPHMGPFLPLPLTWQRRRRELCCFGLAAWTISAPALAATTMSVLGFIPVSALQSPLFVGVIAFAAAMCVASPGIALSLVLAGDETRPGRLSPIALAGMAVPFLLAPLSIVIWWGMTLTGWSAAVMAVLVGVIGLIRRRTAPDVVAGGGDSDSPFPAAPQWKATDIGFVAAAALIGATVASVSLMTSQLLAGAAFVRFAQLAGIVGGVAWGLAVRRKRDAGQQPRGMTGSILITGCWSVLAVAAFPLLIAAMLWANAYVSQVWLLMPLRALLAAGGLLPLGLALGLLSPALSPRTNAQRPVSIALVPAALAGYFAVRWSATDPNLVGPGVGIICLLLGVWRVRCEWSPRFGVRRAILAASCGAVCLLGPLAGGRYDAAQSAKLLFATQTFVAYRTGTRIEHLAALDEGRLVASRTTPRGVWTVWKYYGSQLQFRENGLPRHLTSTDLAVCPQASAELLPAVLPLVVHPRPERVLLAGLGGGATLSTCLAFPVQSVTCAESDSALIEIAATTADPHGGENPLSDPRVALLEVEPALAAAARVEQLYDVIICGENQAALLAAAPQFTTEYYQRLSKRLAAGGIVCQRFQYVDFGSQPLCAMSATLRQVFPQVVMVETAPGEVVFLASCSDAPLVDESIIARAEASHVRRVMSQSAWDWSVLMALAAIDAPQVAAMGEIDGVRPNGAADGRFAFALPPEVMRWGPKIEEIRALLTERSSRMLNWIGDAAELPDITQRLADVTEQRAVISQNPDLFWAYRKTLKHRLQERPRSMIRPVAHEGLRRQMHPEDERRKEYLIALGEAATQARPDAEAIDRLTRFVEPFDPLVSFFVHHEAAYLCERAEMPDRRGELAHRLHTVYFGAGYDRSIRNVTGALELIVSHPDVLPAPQERWDHLAALLEVLRQRWNVRTQTGETSSYTAADIEQSLALAKRALDEMDALAASVPVSAADWRVRREVLDRRLLRPLRTYRAQAAERSRSRHPVTAAAGPATSG